MRVFWRLLPPVVIGAFGCAGFIAFIASYSGAAWLRLASIIELSSTPPTLPETLQDRIANRSGGTLRSVCPYDLAASRLTVAKEFHRRARSEHLPTAEIARRAEQTERAAKDAIACQPMNGRFWYELAAIEKARGLPASRFLNLMAISRRFGPGEAQLMYERSLMMASLIGRPELGRDRAAVAEMRRVLAYLHRSEAVSLLLRVEARGRPETAQVLLSSLPAEQRVPIAASLEGARERLRAAQERREFEFTPFGPAAEAP